VVRPGDGTRTGPARRTRFDAAPGAGIPLDLIGVGRVGVMIVDRISGFRKIKGCSQGTAETGNRMILMGEDARSGQLLGL